MEDKRYEDVINNIKRIIKEKGMKQGVVAERAGFSKQEFSNIFNDRRKLLRIEHICPIAEALGVEPNELYGIVSQGTVNVKGKEAEVRIYNGEITINEERKKWDLPVIEDGNMRITRALSGNK